MVWGKPHLFNDNCQTDAECQVNISALPYVTYAKWQSSHYPSAQTSAIEKCISNVKLTAPSAWVLSCDIDEYPFSVSDTSPNHLQRRIVSFQNDTSQILMRSMFFGGTGTNRPRNLHVSLLEHYTYRHVQAEGRWSRTKPIFKAALAGENQNNIVHEISMKSGQTVVADPDLLRLNHYWGNRLNYPFSELKLDTLASSLNLLP